MDAIFGDIPVTFVLVIHQRGSRRDRFIGLSLTNNSIDPFGSYSRIHFGMKNKTQYIGKLARLILKVGKTCLKKGASWAFSKPLENSSFFWLKSLQRNFLSTSLLGASRCYFFLLLTLHEILLTLHEILLTLHEISLYFTLINFWLTFG